MSGLDFDQRRLELIAKLQAKLSEERKAGSNLVHVHRRTICERDEALKEVEHLRRGLETAESLIENLEQELQETRRQLSDDEIEHNRRMYTQAVAAARWEGRV